MPKEYEIEPITRLEGHGGLKLQLGDDGKVMDVQFNVQTTRFFEKFVEGRFMEHVPRITPRICGICPIPHHLTATKAVEAAWGVEIPKPALKLRELLINAKQYSSHALHFYALAAPDFLYGPFAPAAKRNVVNVINDLPEAGAMALKMMDFGQKLCANIGGKSIHPISAIAGGMKKAFSEESRDAFLKQVNEQVEFTKKTVDIALAVVNAYWGVVANVGTVPTWYVGMCKPDGTHDIYDGVLRTVSPEGVKRDFAPKDYLDAIGEVAVKSSYGTHTFVKEGGYPGGIYRTNCLAMTNAADRMATPLADGALKAMEEKCGGTVIHNVFAYHWARIIELVESIERVAGLLQDPDIVSPDIKTMDVTPIAGRGVGLTEAPRGVLIYDLTSDEKGICKKANLMVATNHNLGGINKTLEAVAKQVFEQNALDVVGPTLPEIKGKTLLG
ncbi:MAG: Ni/Fe hydrogenase subunit alpha [archaeon]|nr:Ni/Fe hydrogenase subunit alpha [archaeon]